MTDYDIQIVARGHEVQRTIRFLLLGTLLSGMALYIYLPTLPPYAVSLGASLSLVGLISGSYGIFQFLLRIPLGLLSDRWQRPRLIVMGGGVCAVLACLGLYLSTDPRSFVIWRSLASLAAATQGVLAALVALQFESNQTSRAMGFFSFVLFLSIACGPMVGGFVAQELGWQAPFAVGIGLGVAGLVVLAAIRDPSLQTSAVSLAVSPPMGTRSVLEPAGTATFAPVVWNRLAAILQQPHIVQTVTLMAVIGFTQYVTTHTFIPIRAVELGAAQTQLGLMTFLTMGMNSVVGLLSGNVIVARIGSRWTVGIGLLLVGLSVAAVPWISGILLLTVAQLASGIGWGLGIPILMAWSLEAVEIDDQGTAASMCLTGGSLGVFIGPIVGGLVADWLGLNATFIMVGGLCFLAACWPIVQARRLQNHTSKVIP